MSASRYRLYSFNPCTNSSYCYPCITPSTCAQVLHRPPVSAIYFENRAHNMVASAHVWTKSQFSAPQTTKSILDGACVLTLTNLQEEYW